MTETMPIWAIILGIISFLATLLLAVVGFALRTQIAALRSESAAQATSLVGEITGLKDTIKGLVTADARLGDTIARIEKDLADYKLHVAERYAKSERVEELISSLFNRLDALPDMIRTEVERASRIIHKRIDDLHQNGHKEQ